MVRDCSGYIFPEQQPATNLITCDTVAEEGFHMASAWGILPSDKQIHMCQRKVPC
ncbi:hypothetical protein KIL84_010475 [Mauremys mutica]|uniref:Uncharacterized protein n=1 Tax=Mauremys mutica TaxID=74926 RepID=A0A9D4B025_9SAUR|nr:hypothetical protein KIL84_010475 [Mauremys mutica]